MNKKTVLNSEHWSTAASNFEAQGQPYVLVTILGVRGSTPRENGTKMVVGSDTRGDLLCYGTIGGGHLEYQAIDKASELLSQGDAQQLLENYPLGARLGQCCGGSVAVLFECFTPRAVNLMLFGAGHVGKALIKVLGELPCQVRWVDARAELFGDDLPDNVSTVIADNPVDAIASMPANSYYLIMTHNHGLDFELCSEILARGDAHYLGLIGSDTKWQRFQLRFEHRGHPPAFYQQIRCPVGLSQVPGKLPMEVAVSIAGEIINDYQSQAATRPTQRGLKWRELNQPLAGEAGSATTARSPEQPPLTESA